MRAISLWTQTDLTTVLAALGPLKQAGEVDASVRVVHDLVSRIEPWDRLEAHHRNDTLGWLETTDDVFRRSKPATPDRHLVSYVVLVDPADSSVLLVDHRNAGLWLPPGGHVEPGEDPAATARREATEELGVELVLADASGVPSFVTVTETVGCDSGHIDVSLWFVFVGRRHMRLRIDLEEFSEARWWAQADLDTLEPNRLDPHYLRFVAKMTRLLPGDGSRDGDPTIA